MLNRSQLNCLQNLDCSFPIRLRTTHTSKKIENDTRHMPSEAWRFFCGYRHCTRRNFALGCNALWETFTKQHGFSSSKFHLKKAREKNTWTAATAWPAGFWECCLNQRMATMTRLPFLTKPSWRNLSKSIYLLKIHQFLLLASEQNVANKKWETIARQFRLGWR